MIFFVLFAILVLCYALIFQNLNPVLPSTFVFWDCAGIHWICLYLCPQISSLTYDIWLLPWWRLSLLKFVSSCPFLAGPIFVPLGIHNLATIFCHSEWHAECLSITGSFTLFFSSFLSSSASTPEFVSATTESNTLSVSFPDVVVIPDVMPNWWDFNF